MSRSPMSSARTSTFYGGSNVPSSTMAASMSLPQKEPVQPPRRSHSPSATTTSAARLMERGSRKRRGMALNISLGGERRQSGRPERFPPSGGDSRGHLRKRDWAFQDRRERRLSAGLYDRLRPIEENGSVLQKGIAPAHFGRADQLALIHQNLASCRGCQTGGRTARRTDGRGDGETGIDPQRAEGTRQPPMNRPVRAP